LKKAKCERTLKLFEENNKMRKNEKVCTNFINYLKRKESEKEIENDDLGFEINFGEYQKHIKYPTDDKNRIENKKKKRKRHEKSVPKDFIRKIEKLGMNVKDAEILYQCRIDWSVVYSENKIYCIEPGCNFFSKIDNKELTNHMISVHKYGDHPCDHPHCDYVATSKIKLLSFPWPFH